MQPQELEPEAEEFFLRLVPDLANQWKGATEDEIARLETIARRPLPRFYRWFLMRMGNERRATPVSKPRFFDREDLGLLR